MCVPVCCASLQIWTINKRHIDPVAPRYTAITKEDRAVLELSNVDGSASVVVSVDLHPKNPAVGKKVSPMIPFCCILNAEHAKHMSRAEL